MNTLKKVMIIAPFWGNPQHVGCYRVERFLRWLHEKSDEIVLVRAGWQDAVREQAWGVEITVRDPLHLYGERTEDHAQYVLPHRPPNHLRRMLAYLFLCPDPTVVWALRAAYHPLVLQAGVEIDWVLSSSPPESAHVCAYLLARRFHAKLLIDMRDGWLDEPLKPLLQRSHFRQLLEGKLEFTILRQATQIFVTSDTWKSLLEKRLPLTQQKTVVLTNAYPKDFEVLCVSEKRNTNKERLTFIHAGRFSGSRDSQRPRYLLDILSQGIDSIPKGNILLLGNLTNEDIQEIYSFKSTFAAKGWTLETHNSLPRTEMLHALSESDGLLLLSASQAVIPSKLFEYIPTGRPILAVTPTDSTVWKIGERVPQMFLVDYTKTEQTSTVRDFFRASQNQYFTYQVPQEFTETSIAQFFYNSINIS